MAIRNARSVDLNDVADIVREAGIYCTIEHTGGNVWTLVAGDVLCGPGSRIYDGTVPAWIAELVVGVADRDGISAAGAACLFPEDVAALVIAQHRAAPVPLSLEDVESLGLDGTGRGIRPDERTGE